MDKYHVGLLLLNLMYFGLTIISNKLKPNRAIGFGYKTPMSLKNNKTWLLANQFASKYQLICFFIVLLLSVFFVIYLNSKEAFISTSAVMTIISISIIPITEYFLKIMFDKKGNFKNYNYENKEY